MKLCWLAQAHLLLCSLGAGDPCATVWPQTPSLCRTFEFCFCASVPDGFCSPEELLHEASQDSYLPSHKLQDKTNLLPHLPLGWFSKDHMPQTGSVQGFLLLFSHEVMSYFFATPWTVAHQAPLSMGFPWQEYRSGMPFPSPGDLPGLGIEPASPAMAGRFFTI